MNKNNEMAEKRYYFENDHDAYAANINVTLNHSTIEYPSFSYFFQDYCYKMLLWFIFKMPPNTRSAYGIPITVKFCKNEVDNKV